MTVLVFIGLVIADRAAAFFRNRGYAELAQGLDYLLSLGRA